MKTPILLLFCAALTLLAADPARQPLPLTKPVQDKNFYALSLLDRTPGVHEAIASNKVLAGLRAAKVNQLHNSPTRCLLATDCYLNALKFTGEEMGQVREELIRLYNENPAVKAMVDGPLRNSGAYVRYHAKPGAELLGQAWVDAAKGMNNMMEVYGLGRAPRYPAIDSITFDPASDSYKRTVSILALVLDDDRANLTLFFQPSLRFALGLMDNNSRDEAGRLEPMEAGENAAAYRRIPTIDWQKFPFTTIVVLGSGTDRPNLAMSPYGKLRTAIAAKRWKDGLAPFILVSGGYVHPMQTPYCEALEMKKALIKDYGIPENAILIDPHARHTTTNIRNAARIMYRYGIPTDRPGLITSDNGQSASVESPLFKVRCLNELGYEPYKNLKRYSVFDLEFLPNIESLQIDPIDPLDP